MAEAFVVKVRDARRAHFLKGTISNKMKDIVLIILLQLAYVPMLTLRTICMVKNLSILAAVFGFLESLIYIFGLAIVFRGEQSILEMIVYALGFGVGLALGVFIEKKLAIGYTSIQVNINHENNEMIDFLRENGFGVTVFQGKGRAGYRYRLDILTKRSREKELMNWINRFEPQAFVIAYQPVTFKGGYLTRVMSKSRRTNPAEAIELTDETETQPSWLKEIINEVKEIFSYGKEM